MRRAVVLIAALAVVAPTVAHGTHAAARAQLRLVDEQPLTVRGTGFKARERVRLTIAAGSRVVRQATAGSGGGFTMRLPGVDVNNCTGFSAMAVGNEGSRATYKRPPGQCAQP